ncbi:MAG: sulfite exporter TauE/SafE family protein [Acidobacteria bacterium]|nr:sulfite exporter TauE/SafE family protein [Acidobacteriota bacterium]
MTAVAWWIVLSVGTVIGVCVGMIGTSGILLISTMTLVFGMSQLRAQGTSLFVAALPVWWFALYPYARARNVDWRMGALLACGLAVGSYFGARWVQHLPELVVRRIFGAALALAAARMFWSR